MRDKIKEQMAVWNRLYKEQDELYHSFAQRFGLSDTAFWVLYALCEATYEERPPYTQNDLCNAWFYPKQTVNSAINKLAKDGYVSLKQMEGTRNRKAIYLTEAGTSFCESTIMAVLKAERTSFARFTAAERETLLSLWEKQIKFLKEDTEACT